MDPSVGSRSGSPVAVRDSVGGCWNQVHRATPAARRGAGHRAGGRTQLPARTVGVRWLCLSIHAEQVAAKRSEAVLSDLFEVARAREALVAPAPIQAAERRWIGA